MNHTLRMSIGGRWWPFPRLVFWVAVLKEARRFERAFAFSDEHHRLRNTAVREMIRTGAAVTVDWLAEEAGLSSERTRRLLDELEREVTILARDERGDVIHAYPAVARVTPHHLAFESGERCHAA